ncbi:hypothetical protein MWU54_01540 [Marivita sp. S6314]|uniref:hypothetical protein n=1 Tax=Marivita sp. S6314 TaxID=2926406 RepID=UPI001FF5EC80|nr:hypothetical protein [Marivita sp. S6314]MCK0148693.1 hypothetical protein [Marivita sp. S6314]
MKRTLRKQDRNDFLSRIERLDPKFAALPQEARVERKPWEVEKSGLSKAEKPVLMTLLGFGLAIGALMAVNDPARVQTLLLTSGWPSQFLTYAMNGVSILVIGLAIFFLGNLFRIVNPRASGRWNAGGLVIGAIAAVGMFSLPDSYVQAGYEYAGFNNATEILDYAQERTLQLASIDWASVVMVSSSAK